jgi:hypothetical protein
MRVAAIRIDVHPAGENPTNMTRTLPTPIHVCPTYVSYGRSPYVATFRDLSTRLDRCTAPEKKCTRFHLSAQLSGLRACLSFSPNTTIEAVHLSQAPVDGRLLGLPGPYHWHAISTFNSCSRVPTPRSLTDIGGGYHIETSE